MSVYINSDNEQTVSTTGEYEHIPSINALLYPWIYKGKKYLHNSYNEVWTESEDWQGVYLPTEDRFDNTVPEPELYFYSDEYVKQSIESTRNLNLNTIEFEEWVEKNTKIPREESCEEKREKEREKERIEEEKVERERVERIEKEKEDERNLPKKYCEVKRIHDLAVDFHPKLPSTVPFDIDEFKNVVKKYDEETDKYNCLVKNLKKELVDIAKRLTPSQWEKVPYRQRIIIHAWENAILLG